MGFATLILQSFPSLRKLALFIVSDPTSKPFFLNPSNNKRPTSVSCFLRKNWRQYWMYFGREWALSSIVSPYPLNLFQVRETFLPLFVQNRRESSLWLCSLLFPIVAWRLFPASWGTVSFCSAISIALFQVVVLARVPYNTLFSNCSFNRSTISSSLILYARCFGLRKVRF
jgi:hypothetical protein